MVRLSLKKDAMRQRIEYFFVWLLLKLAAIMPKKALFGLTKMLAKLLYRLDRKRRNIAVTNLMQALGKSEEEAERLALQNYEEVAKTVAEILLLFNQHFDFDAIDDAQLQKIAHLKAPVIFLTAHIGNWEALAQLLAKRGFPMGVVGRKGNNELIEKRITLPFRQRYGNWLIYKHEAAKSLVRALRNGKNVGLLLDQRGGKAGIWVDFLGRLASTVPTAYMLQKRFGAPIVPIFLVREGERLRVVVDDVIEWEEMDEATHTKKINEAYERIIKAYPTQWFWMHERWRK